MFVEMSVKNHTMKARLIIIGLLFSSVLFSCVKTRNCECKQSWVEQSPWGPVDKEEIVAYPLKGTKANAKTECDIIKTNMAVADDVYVSCELK